MIEQIDGQIESSLISFDLTISATNIVDAYCSMEDNLCYGDIDEKVHTIGDAPSSEVKEPEGENIFSLLKYRSKMMKLF